MVGHQWMKFQIEVVWEDEQREESPFVDAAEEIIDEQDSPKVSFHALTSSPTPNTMRLQGKLQNFFFNFVRFGGSHNFF